MFDMAREELAMEANSEIRTVDSLPPSLNLYEAQFFGYTPQTCMLRVYSAFQGSLCDTLAAVEEFCVRQQTKGASDDCDKEQLRNKARERSQKLQQFLDEKFMHLAKPMETLLKRCLTVPPSVLLPEDQSHSKYPQKLEAVQRLESSMTDLQRAYEAEVWAKQALLAELQEQREVQKELDGILSWVQELQAAWVKEGNGNFSESFRLVMESVKKLQQAVGEVYEKSSSLN